MGWSVDAIPLKIIRSSRVRRPTACRRRLQRTALSGIGLQDFFNYSTGVPPEAKLPLFPVCFAPRTVKNQGFLAGSGAGGVVGADSTAPPYLICTSLLNCL